MLFYNYFVFFSNKKEKAKIEREREGKKAQHDSQTVYILNMFYVYQTLPTR